MTLQLGHYLALSTVLFTIGAAGFLARRNALVALMAIELMLNAVNLMLVAANRWQAAVPDAASDGAAAVNAAANAASNAGTNAGRALGQVGAFVSQSPIPHHGQVFAFFVIAVAAAEAAVGLAIVLAFYRLRKTVRTDAADLLRG